MNRSTYIIIILAAVVVLLLSTSGVLFKSNSDFEAEADKHKKTAALWEKKYEAEADTARAYKKLANETFSEAVEIANTEEIQIEYVPIHVDIRNANMPQLDSILARQLSEDRSN